MTGDLQANFNQMTEDLKNLGQFQSETQKQQMERWKIIQDTQTKIFEIMPDVTNNRSKTQDKMFNKWDEYIRY